MFNEVLKCPNYITFSGPEDALVKWVKRLTKVSLRYRHKAHSGGGGGGGGCGGDLLISQFESIRPDFEAVFHATTFPSNQSLKNIWMLPRMV